MRLLVAFAVVILGAACGLSYLLEWRDDLRRASRAEPPGASE